MNKPIIIPCGVTVTFDNAIFLEILNHYGVTGWNSWIDAVYKLKLLYPCFDISANAPSFQIEFYLRDIDLSNRSLDLIDLTLVYVSKGNFRDSSLYGAKILMANQCDFSGADLRTAFLNSCNVSKAVFVDAMLDGINWNRTYYYKGNPPIGLPDDIMARLQQLEPDDAEMPEPKQIPCLAEIQDASHWLMAKD